MRRIIRVLILVFLGCHAVNGIGQPLKLGVGFGGIMYSGDLSGSPDIGDLNAFNPAFYAFASIPVSGRVHLRLQSLYGQLEGDDRHSDAPDHRMRNLRFKSPFTELSINAEIDLFTLKTRLTHVTPKVAPGFGIFHFNPSTEYNGSTVPLQPLGTEGQGLEGYNGKYKRIQVSFPIGGILSFRVGERMYIEASAMVHFTTTDYLDDVSSNYPDFNKVGALMAPLGRILSNRTDEFQGIEEGANDGFISNKTRGNSDNKDLVTSVGIAVVYRFDRIILPLAKEFNYDKHCPKF